MPHSLEMLLSRTRRTREVNGPTPHSCAIVSVDKKLNHENLWCPGFRTSVTTLIVHGIMILTTD